MGSAEMDETATVFSSLTGDPTCVLRGHTAPITCIAIAGRLVLTGSKDRSARLFDIETGRQVKVFKSHRAPITSVALSHNGIRALTGSVDHTACVWNVATGRLIIELGASEEKETKFSVALGRKIETSKGHTTKVLAVALSHDGSLALTGSADATARCVVVHFWPCAIRHTR